MRRVMKWSFCIMMVACAAVINLLLPELSIGSHVAMVMMVIFASYAIIFKLLKYYSLRPENLLNQAWQEAARIAERSWTVKRWRYNTDFPEWPLELVVISFPQELGDDDEAIEFEIKQIMNRKERELAVHRDHAQYTLWEKVSVPGMAVRFELTSVQRPCGPESVSPTDYLIPYEIEREGADPRKTPERPGVFLEC